MLRGKLKYLVLLVLSRGPSSGYGLMKVLEADLGKKPSPGSIYPILHALKKQKEITVTKKTKGNSYTITTNGRQELETFRAKTKELSRVVQEHVHMFSMLSKEQKAFFSHINESLDHNQVSFPGITGELMEMRVLIGRLMLLKPQKNNLKELKGVFSKTIKSLTCIIQKCKKDQVTIKNNVFV